MPRAASDLQAEQPQEPLRGTRWTGTHDQHEVSPVPPELGECWLNSILQSPALSIPLQLGGRIPQQLCAGGGGRQVFH